MSDDAIDERFKQAFVAANPVTAFLDLLAANPHYMTVREIVLAYFELGEEAPSKGRALVTTLLELVGVPAPDSPSIDSQSLPLSPARELVETHFKTSPQFKVRKYGTTNTHLIESLLSGLSLHHSLACGADQVAHFVAGLDLDPSTSSSSTKYEETEEVVVVVGTCIQLLLSGSTLRADIAGTRTYKRAPVLVARRLISVQAAGIVKDPNAVEVLDLKCTPSQD